MLISLPMHEFAHALAAYKLGDDTAKQMGRLTLNPLKHLDLLGAALMVFTGFGWAKPVPINPNNFRNRKTGFALSALAGPVSNLILAYLAIVILRLLSLNPNSLVGLFFYYLAILNIGLGVFNLIPVPPLDGSRIFSLILPEKQYFKIMKYEGICFLLLFIAMQFPFFTSLIGMIQQFTWRLLLLLTNWMSLFGH
ncbi:MAG: site-2 protease family protein [Ruminococcus sp.]|jgi:Zn-dependent protease|nr:site-2 protease family protein [Ruminococcus sp.]